MFEFLAEEINLEKKALKEQFLEKIDKNIIKNNFEFLILKIQKFETVQIKSIIDEIKKHFDIFIIIKIIIPKNTREIESYFYTGAHGIIFMENLKKNYIQEIDIIEKSTNFFPIGSVFYEISNPNKDFIFNLIEKNIIPVIKNCDIELLKNIQFKLNKKRALKGYLKFIPLLEQTNCDYSKKNFKEHSLKDKVEKKIILEINNLRQKLMIKEVSDSFDSSSL